mmetsp:Transcript_170529/g.546946  ORF Transcript_170529/g.546946 Transcript_170529/m.546946 type:complete len:113 (-) Transcript_170529:2036-2374(-)
MHPCVPYTLLVPCTPAAHAMMVLTPEKNHQLDEERRRRRFLDRERDFFRPRERLFFLISMPAAATSAASFMTLDMGSSAFTATTGSISFRGGGGGGSCGSSPRSFAARLRAP